PAAAIAILVHVEAVRPRRQSCHFAGDEHLVAGLNEPELAVHIGAGFWLQEHGCRRSHRWWRRATGGKHEQCRAEQCPGIHASERSYFTVTEMVLLSFGPYDRCAPSANCRLNVCLPGGSFTVVSVWPLPKCRCLSSAGITLPSGTGSVSINR